MKSQKHLVSSVALATLLFTGTVQKMFADSFYTQKPEDPKAINLADFGAKGDGVADDTAAIEAAINKVVDTTKKGVVLIPEGKYRITKTIYVYNGIRLIGYGKNRPTILLAEKTPGFQEQGPEKGFGAPSPGKYMFHFVADRPREAGQAPRDANPGTFYSAFTNIDVEIAAGNPAAVAIRSHWAQHCFVSHCTFTIGTAESPARAAVEQVGNEIENCRFIGGTYGLWTTKPSPSWPFVLLDSKFENQKTAAISTEEGGMSIFRTTFRNMPTAILVHEERAEELIMKDCAMMDITGPAIVISDEKNGRSQTNLINLSCQLVPTLIQFRESKKTIQGTADAYSVDDFTHGNHITDFAGKPEHKTTIKTTPNIDFRIVIEKTDIAKLPPMDTWVSVAKFGAKGDGQADDTEAFKKAIAQAKTIFIPTGRYKITDTLQLKADTSLVALSPQSVQLFIPNLHPDFSVADPKPVPPPVMKPLIESPKDGTNILMGIGLDAGNNNNAGACYWNAGEKSMISDVRFVGGHGTYRADGSGIPAYNQNRTGDGQEGRVWNSQHASLIIHGGGTFKNLWTPAPLARAGILVTNTETPGRLYQISSEHHVDNEIVFNNVKNWEAWAIQCEEERAEGPACLPLYIKDCENLTFGNLYLYRVNMPQNYIAGVKIVNSKNLTFRGVHAYSPGKNTYDNTFLNIDTDQLIRHREIARLTITDSTKAPAAAPDVKFEKLAEAYKEIDNLQIDSKGNPYFLERRHGGVFKYDFEKKVVLGLGGPDTAVALALDTKDNVILIHADNSVTTLPEGAMNTIALKSIPLTEKPPAEIKNYIHPASRWKDDHDFLIVTQELGNSSPMRQSGRGPGRQPTPPSLVLCPDGVTAVPTSPDLSRAFALTRVEAGKSAYIADEFGQKSYRFDVDNTGKLTNPKLLAEEGECGVTVDSTGKIYVAAGDIFIYSEGGKLLETLRPPERPTSIAIGGKDGKTLLIAARTSLYAITLK